MRIVDAVWEKRNLDVDVKELVCEEKDSSQALRAELDRIDAGYSVVKIPAGRTDMLLCAQDAGYMMMEMSIGVEGRVATMEIPKLFQRFTRAVSVKPADESMKKKVLEEIARGSIFETDRIALDPAFSREIAGRRYYNWTCDELNRGAQIAIAYYKDEPIAFGINHAVDENTYDAFLGGVFEEAANKGLGFLALYANMESIKEQGGKKIVTRVSSNNPPILRLHMQYGYEIKDMSYILVKHQENA